MHACGIFCAVMMGLLQLAAAHAQSDSETLEAFRACSEIERRRARLDCFDQFSGEDIEVLPVDPTTAEDDDAIVDAASSRTENPIAPVASAEPQQSAAPVTDKPESRVDPVNVRIEARRRAATDNQDRISIVVTEIRRNPLTGTIFVAADGRLWRQTSRMTGRYPQAPFETVLERASQGSYFLTSPSGGPTVRVSLLD